MEISLTFYIYFNSDLIADPVEIKSNSDLHVGDVMNFSDHEIRAELVEEYQTTLFTISQRQFSVEFYEMNL